MAAEYLLNTIDQETITKEITMAKPGVPAKEPSRRQQPDIKSPLRRVVTPDKNPIEIPIVEPVQIPQGEPVPAKR